MRHHIKESEVSEVVCLDRTVFFVRCEGLTRYQQLCALRLICQQAVAACMACNEARDVSGLSHDGTGWEGSIKGACGAV